MTYEEVCRNFNEIMSVVEKDHYGNVFNQIEKTVVRKEQATGGGVMHRGYYCPSIVMDIAIGNCNRGRLIKRLRTQKITYTYGFDDLDRLVTVVNHTEVGDFFEYIIYDGDVRYGVQFHHHSWSGEYLYEISKCCYEDGRLQSYERYGYDAYNKNFSLYQGEFYRYSKDSLEWEWVEILNGEKAVRYIRSLNYQFRIEDGVLVDYVTENGDVYPVLKKRRIYHSDSSENYVTNGMENLQ